MRKSGAQSVAHTIVILGNWQHFNPTAIQLVPIDSLDNLDRSKHEVNQLQHLIMASLKSSFLPSTF